MSLRPRSILIIGILLLVSLMLVACERERPPATAVPTIAAPARGTVAPSPTPPVAATQSSLPGTQVTPGAAGAETPTPPAPQQVVVSPSGQTGTTGTEVTYTVQAGDTLALIAARYNVTQEAIVTLNALTDPDVLSVGQQLKIPGASAGTATTTTAAGSTSVYVVQSGDTLAVIARKFDTTVAELVRLNNLSNPDRIAVGQKLTVPAAGSTTTPGAGATPSGQTGTYVVKQGDTLLSIARSYGLTVQAIQAANNITDPDRIYPGQVLVIP